MGKSKRYSKKDDEEAAREERILANFKLQGRIPTPPPGHTHDADETAKLKKSRKKEKHRLRDIAMEHNSKTGSEE
jgi:hypothetical protein